MTPERWQQVKDVFEAALACAPEARAKWLRVACGEDLELHDEIVSLLESHEEAGNFMTAPAFEETAHLLVDDRQAVRVGSRILQYQLVSLLGKGGMGDVYLAIDLRLGRKVALKVLPAEFTSDRDRLRRFAWEAHAVSALNHPNIITIYDQGEAPAESGTIHFMATEFVEGPTLRQRMDAGSLSLRDTLEIVAQITGALVAAHAAGIVHRDIKPENVMVRPDGYVKVLDFGLAKLPESPEPVVELNAARMLSVETRTDLIMGTPSYLSPEQVRGEKVDARSDLFSVGVVLYEMLSGRHPFRGGTLSDILAAVLRAELPPLPDVPGELQRIVSRALLRERGARYQTAQELLDDLRQLQNRLGGEPMSLAISSRNLPIPAPSGKPAVRSAAALARRAVCRSRRLIPTLALLIVMLSILAGIGYLSLTRDERTIDSIAVLPLANLSGDPNLESLSDGIAETITSNLSQLPKLKVMSRTSTVRFKDQQFDLQEVGRRLQVKAVLIGQVTRYADKLIVKLELVDTRDRRQLWGDQYQKIPLDLLTMQADVSRWASRQLWLKLGGSDGCRHCPHLLFF